MDNQKTSSRFFSLVGYGAGACALLYFLFLSFIATTLPQEADASVGMHQYFFMALFIAYSISSFYFALRPPQKLSTVFWLCYLLPGIAVSIHAYIVNI
jgi:hypothetical protein